MRGPLIAHVPISEESSLRGSEFTVVVHNADAGDLGWGRSFLGRGLLAAPLIGLLSTGRGNGVGGRAVLVREGDADRLVHDVAGHHQ